MLLGQKSSICRDDDDGDDDVTPKPKYKQLLMQSDNK